MKDIFEHFNKVFENRVRLAVMSVLVVSEGVEFNVLKEMLSLTDGNLASHITTLEKSGYLSIEKKFVGKKTQTTYLATPAGKQAFNDHVNALEQFLRSARTPAVPPGRSQS